MNLMPPPGVCLPVIYRRVLSGGRVEICLPIDGNRCIHEIRLAEIDVPSLDAPGGLCAKHTAELALEDCDHLHLWLEPPVDLVAMLASYGPGPLSGHLFLDEAATLSQILRWRGQARRPPR